ncbi:1,4-alpha-glucan branching enzyme [Chromatiales bacterium (ex Bugula neritina AB1)]|nr:1,4-alpha-glucan branching enzyme [Chromatiales bacterium (ex Bugula neritina AB1)]
MKTTHTATHAKALPPEDELHRITRATHHDPFAVLGWHLVDSVPTIRIFNPHAESLCLADSGEKFDRIPDTDLFVLSSPDLKADYKIKCTDRNGNITIADDPYRFAPSISEFDLHLFNEGRHLRLYEVLGARKITIEGVTGVRFAVWAPSSSRVSVVGEFNQWDGRVHPMRNRGQSGVWELFIPGLISGQLYKFELLNAETGEIAIKQDPFANEFEMRPDTACRTTHSNFSWTDQQWIENRARSLWQQTPASIYEVHLGSWQRNDDGEFLNYREIAKKLVEYVQFTGFTHIELMPITEHPLDASWGYQVTGYFAPSSRFGTPDDFRFLIDHCHQAGIGVILDWVPAHFPRDSFGLARYDGSCLYEHSDPRLGEHRDWGTLIFNYGRREVSNFLLASALYWLREFHLDGLRVDAVASMLYLDYSREPGDWLPNKDGGRENLEAVQFLRDLNHTTQTEVPGSVIIAEESTSWPQVTRPPDHDGLGFSMKWNMGWMHDSLSYIQEDPINRRHHHSNLTFGLLYLYTENFVLPFSHDEVVHGKGSMLSRMPGDDWQQFANLRLLYSYQFTYPGKKLLFQGCEFAQRNEWDFNSTLDWELTHAPAHRGILLLIADLNHLYQTHPGLFEREFSSDGFEWINADDSSNSVLAYARTSPGEHLLVILNFTPVPRHDYRIGVNHEGIYSELLNSDNERYGGSQTCSSDSLTTIREPCMGRPYSLSLTLPPLSAIVLQHTPS